MGSGFLAIAYKEFLHLSRNKLALSMLVFVTLVDFVLMGSMTLTIRHMPAVVVDHDRSVASRELLRQLAATESFDLSSATNSEAQARSEIRSGEAKVAFVIPPDYARRLKSGEDPSVLALVDGANGSIATQAIATLDGVANRLNVQTLQAQSSPAPQIESHVSVLFNPQNKLSYFLLPALLVVMMSGMLHLSSATLARERNGGNLDRLLMTPVKYPAIILGKLAPFFGLAVIEGVIAIAVMRVVFEIPVRGSVLLLFLGIILHACALLALGMLLAARAGSPLVASLQTGLILTSSSFLSGFYFPLSSVPIWLRPWSYLLPTTHGIAIMRGICLRGANVADLIPSFAYLVFAPIVFTLWSAKRFSASAIQ